MNKLRDNWRDATTTSRIIASAYLALGLLNLAGFVGLLREGQRGDILALVLVVCMPVFGWLSLVTSATATRTDRLRAEIERAEANALDNERADWMRNGQ